MWRESNLITHLNSQQLKFIDNLYITSVHGEFIVTGRSGFTLTNHSLGLSGIEKCAILLVRLNRVYFYIVPADYFFEVKKARRPEPYLSLQLLQLP